MSEMVGAAARKGWTMTTTEKLMALMGELRNDAIDADTQAFKAQPAGQ